VIDRARPTAIRSTRADAKTRRREGIDALI